MKMLRNVVAVVDDNVDMRRAMRDLLWAFDYDVDLYDSAESFLSRVTDCKASCLLVDIQLGGMTGIELRRRLTSSGFTTPVIFMTASDDDLIRKQALEEGCAAFLHKPFRAPILIDAIRKALG
jgi:FixJ family two-component response regulator